VEPPTVKAILGYDLAEGTSKEEYDRWLLETHVPDLLANPYLDRIVFNTVVRPVATTSMGSPAASDMASFYRIGELHFASHDAYERYLAWFQRHPIPAERGPGGKTVLRFYVLTDTVEVGRAT
jgi:hypothetical protein